MQRFMLPTLVCSGLIVSGIGCNGGSSDYKKTTELKKAPEVHDEHEHGAKGPHGGSLVELGAEEFHAEVVLDHDAHAIRVFVLGKDAKTATPTAATELTLTPEGKDALTLKAVPQEGDGEGKSSRFELIDDDIVHTLMDAGMIHGKLRVTIDDKPFSGNVDYHLDDVKHEHKDEKPADTAPKTDPKLDVPKADDAAKEAPATESTEPEPK